MLIRLATDGGCYWQAGPARDPPHIYPDSAVQLARICDPFMAGITMHLRRLPIEVEEDDAAVEDAEVNAVAEGFVEEFLGPAAVDADESAKPKPVRKTLARESPAAPSVRRLHTPAFYRESKKRPGSDSIWVSLLCLPTVRPTNNIPALAHRHIDRLRSSLGPIDIVP